MAQNNVSVTQLPGQYNTYGTASYGGGFGAYQSRTSYTPGPTVVSGSHDKSLTLVMFNPGDPGFDAAIDARKNSAKIGLS
ncbi:hypothetical protein WOC76_02395 [Methylocystis sp. IM3]|uniref:hypothetical protein n=1 Tax=unclassified Methylocystis TaxID=2625913 RepID=UPI0030F4DF2B